MINIHDLPQKAEIVEMSDVEAAQITGGARSWFESMALAWGEALKAQSQKIKAFSAGMGAEQPSQLSQLH